MLTTFPLRVPSAKTKKRMTATALEEKLLGRTVSPDARESEKSFSGNDRIRLLRTADDYLRDKINNDHNCRFVRCGLSCDVIRICTGANYRDLCIEYTIHRQGANPIHDTLNQCYIPKYAKYTLKQLYDIWLRHARAAIKS